MARTSSFRVLLIFLAGTGLVVIACGGFVVWRFVLPSLGPLLVLRAEIVKAYPDSNPSVNVLWVNGRKSISIAAATNFEPSQDSTSAQAVAGRIAGIVRQHYDLTGYTAIQVRLERRRSAGVVHFKTGKSFRFPVAP